MPDATLERVSLNAMFLIDNGSSFVRDVEKNGAVAMWVTPEGGAEGNYQRRLRGAGYKTLHMTAKGLGDLERFLLETHGVRPAHLGKKDKRVYDLPPELALQMDQLPDGARGLVLWLIEGKVLSLQELDYLAELPAQVSKLKIVIEVGSDFKVRWKPLREAVSNIAEGR